MAGLTSARRWQLRRIFLQKRESYSPTEAARVLGLPRPNVVAMIEHKEVDAETRVTHRLPWASVASLALDRCSVADVIDALGKDAAAAVPALLFPAEPLLVTLPLYQRRMLEHCASVAGVTVAGCLVTILRAYAEELLRTPRVIEDAVPGFLAAVHFPDDPETLA